VLKKAVVHGRTRLLARVIGPFTMIVGAILMARTEEIPPVLTSFFQSSAMVWFVGGVLLLLGLVIIAIHQIWSSLAAIAISLFGWFLALRGVVLLVTPDLIQSAGVTALTVQPLVRAAFGFLVAFGLWITYIGWFERKRNTA
jgi:hypothetical protein